MEVSSGQGLVTAQSEKFSEKIKVYSFQDAINKSKMDSLSKLLLYVIYSHASKKTKSCFPSASKLAAETSMSRMSVFRKLTTLEEMGFVKRENRYLPKGMTSNVYHLILPQQFSLQFRPIEFAFSNGYDDDEDEDPSITELLGSNRELLGGSNRELHRTNQLLTNQLTAGKKTKTATNLPQSSKAKNKGGSAKSAKQPLQKQQQDSIFQIEKIPSEYLTTAKQEIGLEGSEKDSLIQDVFTLFQDHYQGKFCRNPLIAWKMWVKRENALKMDVKAKPTTPPSKTDAEATTQKAWSDWIKTGQDQMEREIDRLKHDYAKTYAYDPMDKQHKDRFRKIQRAYLQTVRTHFDDFESVVAAEFGMRKETV